jgi:psiF repeat
MIKKTDDYFGAEPVFVAERGPLRIRKNQTTNQDDQLQYRRKTKILKGDERKAFMKKCLNAN